MAQSLNNLCVFLDWDTAFFNHRIAKVIPHTFTQLQAELIDDWCIQQNVECLYFLASSNDKDTVRIAEDNHYRQVDVRVMYEFRLDDLDSSYEQIKSQFVLDDASNSDIDDMLNMIDNAFEDTRFYYDPYFSDEQCNNLYKTWLVRSIKDVFADHVFVIRQEGKPQAFITCQLNNITKVGSIGLIGVAETARGQGLAKFLIDRALEYFLEAKIDRAQVITQGRNISANRLYQKCGFRTSEVYLWYHKWFNQDQQG